MSRRQETIGRESWRPVCYRDGTRVDVWYGRLESRDEAEAWAREHAKGLDVELWVRPAGKVRYERTTFGWSAETRNAERGKTS